MLVNPIKSDVVHCSNPSVNLSVFVFKTGSIPISYASQYKYFGMLITEHLDFSVTAKHVAQAANRALGLHIAKGKSFGGLPYC